MKRSAAALLSLILALSALTVPAYAETAEQTAAKAAAASTSVEPEKIEYNENATYGEFLDSVKDTPGAKQEIVLDASKITAKSSGVQLKQDYDGHSGTSVYAGEEDSITYTFDVPEDAMYNLYIDYHTESGKNVSIQREFRVNGSLPYDKAAQCTFNRVWVDDTGTDDGSFRKDAYGNDIRPTQVENYSWTGMYAYDYLGYEASPLKFAFKKGTNTLEIRSVKEPMTIGSVKLTPVLEMKKYKDALSSYEQQGLKKYEGEEVFVQAENPTSKSDQTLYPSADTSSCSTTPTQDFKQIINMLGGSRWQYAQQSVTWTINAPEDGLYKINIKFRKNLYQGMLSCRSLFVNGEIPFEEAESLRFSYETDWALTGPQTEDGEDCYIPLKKGDNTVSLMVTQGVQGEYIQKVSDALAEINDMYRKIIMITGSSPDENTDYNLDTLLPEVVENMGTQADALEYVVEGITAYTGEKGSAFSSLDTLAYQMRQFNKDSELITKQLTLFKTNIGSLGTWVNDAGNSPLEVDYISISAPDGGKDSVQSATKSIFSDIAFGVTRFIGSFLIDYDAIGNTSKNTDKDKTIDVWISTGRDQFQTLRAMINDKYTKTTGNEINLSLVNITALLSAVVAGIGPDVAIGTPKTEPVNFALRGACVDLTQFDTYNEVSKRFMEQALIPATYDNGKKSGVYGLPDTQYYQVMFYRKDILSELGLGVPKTWDDVINTITVLNKNNLEFGLPVTTTLDPTGGLLTFYSLLLQNGGQMFKEDRTATDLYSTAATNAFKMWTNFYSNYELPLTYDFQNRFRTGEMPIGISQYTLYNTLVVAAPEINGLWDFTTIPGTIQEDGTLNVSNSLSSTYTIMLSDCDKKDLAWDFMDWWTSADAQAEYGKELECIMGPSARYNTANIEAFERLPWTRKELDKLKSQLSNTRSIPEIPGSYFLQRHINNAFYSVVNQDTDPKDTLMDYAKTIDEEITKKRSEFGLKTAADVQ